MVQTSLHVQNGACRAAARCFYTLLLAFFVVVLGLSYSPLAEASGKKMPHYNHDDSGELYERVKAKIKEIDPDQPAFEIYDTPAIAIGHVDLNGDAKNEIVAFLNDDPVSCNDVEGCSYYVFIDGQDGLVLIAQFRTKLLFVSENKTHNINDLVLQPFFNDINREMIFKWTGASYEPKKPEEVKELHDLWSEEFKRRSSGAGHHEGDGHGHNHNYIDVRDILDPRYTIIPEMPEEILKAREEAKKKKAQEQKDKHHDHGQNHEHDHEGHEYNHKKEEPKEPVLNSFDILADEEESKEVKE